MQYGDAAGLGRWLRKRAENIAVALLSLMFACFIIQIFFRYVLNNPVGWTEEVIVTTWLWTVLWGAAFILGEAEEWKADLIVMGLPYKRRFGEFNLGKTVPYVLKFAACQVILFREHLET